MRCRATALLLVLVLCAGCTVRAERQARVEDDASVPFGLLEPDAPPLLPTEPGRAGGEVTLCFVRDDEHLTAVSAAISEPADLRAVVAALDRPPGDLRTALAGASLVRQVTLRAGVAHADLQLALAALGAGEQLLAIAQIVCTLTQRPGVGLVSFTLDGAPVDVPRGDGSLTPGPVSRDDYRDMLR
jgi:spore germination protein GerM